MNNVSESKEKLIGGGEIEESWEGICISSTLLLAKVVYLPSSHSLPDKMKIKFVRGGLSHKMDGDALN